MSDFIKRKEDKKAGPVARGMRKQVRPELKILIIGEDNKVKKGTLDADGMLKFRKGGRVCKLAKRGKGRAYGKNS